VSTSADDIEGSRAGGDDIFPLGAPNPVCPPAYVGFITPAKQLSMKLQNLRFLVATVERGGVGKAARYLNMSQPAITGGLKALEKELGGRLFEPNPTGRGVRPTANTLELYQDALDILRKCEGARNRFGTSRKATTLIRVGLLPTIASREIEAFAYATASKYPQLQLCFHEADGSSLGSLLEKRAVDVAWTLIKDDEADTHRLWSEPYVALIGRSHRLVSNGAVSISWADIDGESFVLRGSCETQSLNVWPKSLRMRISAHAERDELALRLVAAGIGIAVGPRSLATTGVVSCPIQELRIERTIGLRWRRDLDAKVLEATLSALRTSTGCLGCPIPPGSEP